MADVWETAVRENDAAKLSRLVLLSAASPQAALEIVRSCAVLLQKEARTSGDANPAAAATAVAPSTSNGNDAEVSEGHVLPLLCTLEGVQLLHPRGRFNLEFRKSGVTVTGKAATLNIAWDNVRHIIRLPRPEGFNWGKSLDKTDPAGSDLLALPLQEPVPLRKTEASLVLLQPDPKASHAEVCISLDGVSHKVSGSQGTVIAGLIKLLCGVKQSVPDKGLFVSRGGKSFVKCYHGVNEGSLFPLRQGLFFMKPALFLPKGDIEQVVCGRGGSATTRYVDLVVGMEVGEDEKESTREFSNIEREDLPSLQSYIQDALVTPRLREAKKAAKAAAAGAVAPPPVPVHTETVEPTVSSAESEVASTGSKAPPSKGEASAARGASTVGGVGEKGASLKEAANGVAQPEDADEEDDGDAESDEDFAPVLGDTDSDDDSGSSVSSASGGSDNDSGSDSEEEQDDGKEEYDDEGENDEGDQESTQKRGDKSGDGNIGHKPVHKRKRLDDGDMKSERSQQPENKKMSKTKVSKQTKGNGVAVEGSGKGGDDTESDEEGRKKKRTA